MHDEFHIVPEFPGVAPEAVPKEKTFQLRRKLEPEIVDPLEYPDQGKDILGLREVR
jgi:hypothetical protein